MSKSKKEHKMSERKKYLRTLMAEMGLSSLDELSKEERKRWIRAAEPQKIVKKKLREMSYSLDSDNNKRSLGRFSKITSFKKSAENTTGKDLDLLRSLLDQSTYQKVMPIVFPLFGISGTFNKSKYVEDSLAAIRESSPSQVNEDKIRGVLESLSNSIAEALPVDLNEAFSDDPNQSFDLSRLSERSKKDITAQLVRSGYLSSLTASDEEVIAAIKTVQSAKGLSSSGMIDKSTYSAIIGLSSVQPPTDTPAPEATTTSLRERRDEIRERRRGRRRSSDEQPISSFDLSKIENINISRRVDLNSSTNELRQFVMILDKICGDMGIKPTITSAFRDDYNQARVMLNNYNRRGSGSRRARVYLETLYKNFPKMNDIITVFESEVLSKEDKILKAESIIKQSWPVGGHRAGKSIDISRESKSTFDDMLNRAKEYANFKKLWENDHYHLTIKSIKSMPREGFLSRLFS